MGSLSCGTTGFGHTVQYLVHQLGEERRERRGRYTEKSRLQNSAEDGRTVKQSNSRKFTDDKEKEKCFEQQQQYENEKK